jgi:hypothetical protein
VRNLELFGETATRIPDAVRAPTPSYLGGSSSPPVTGLIHGYLGIDNDICGALSKATFQPCCHNCRRTPGSDDMTEPTIIWPNCKTEIRLTESLAAPLIAATRKQFEQQPSQKDEEIAKRELN